MNKHEYFIRHTNALEISTGDFQQLCDDQMIGIHFNSNFKNNENDLLNPKFYGGSGRTAMNYLYEIAKNGAYIWCDYSPLNISIIGKVDPSSKVTLRRFRPIKDKHWFKHDTLYLKCLKLTQIKKISNASLLYLKARKPQQGTLVRWHKSYGKIERILNGNNRIESWSDLTPDQQEVLVYEYLSKTESLGDFRINTLLMPIGRTLKDVDIFGVNKNGAKIFCQVTNYGKERVKIEALERYKDEKYYLIYAGSSNNIKTEITGDRFMYLNVQEVFNWAQSMDLIPYFNENY